MNSASTPSRKKAAFGVTTVLLLAASLLTVSSTAGAQGAIFAGCPADSVNFGTEGEFFGTLDYNNHLLSSGPTSQSTDYALPAGTYEIGAVSTDGYEGRELIENQPAEQWFAEFLAADGSVVATTGLTADIQDGVEQGIWSGSLGEVTLASDATQVRVQHASPGGDNPNSVRAVCVGVLSDAELAAVEEAVAEGAAADGAAGDGAADPADSADGTDEAGESAVVDPAVEAEVAGETETAPADSANPADPAPAPEIDPALASSITVIYNSTNIGPEVVTLLCADLGGINTFTEGLGSGPNEASALELIQDPVSAGSTCTVTVPNLANHDCTVSVNPSGLDELVVVEGANNQVITFPTTFETDVFVDIFCTGPGPDGAVDTEVLGEVTSAPIAQATNGEPTFTG